MKFFKVSSFDVGVISYYYTASSTVMKMCKQAFCKICCFFFFFFFLSWKRKVALLEILKVLFQGELHIQWKSLPSFDASYFSKTVQGSGRTLFHPH